MEMLGWYTVRFADMIWKWGALIRGGQFLVFSMVMVFLTSTVISLLVPKRPQKAVWRLNTFLEFYWSFLTSANLTLLRCWYIKTSNSFRKHDTCNKYQEKKNTINHLRQVVFHIPFFHNFFSFLSILLTGKVTLRGISSLIALLAWIHSHYGMIQIHSHMNNKIGHFLEFNFFNSCHFRVDCKKALVNIP